MGFYQKRVTVIEAKQWRASNPAEVTDWLDENDVDYLIVDNRVHIRTHFVAHDGDMILKNDHGFEVLRLDLFAEEYESVLVITKHNTPRQSNLVDHAKRELELVGEDQDVISGYLNVIQAFADMGHSGGSASVAIPVINELLQFKNLSDLTNNPDEWVHVAEEQWGSPGGIWQSKRNSEAFSNDSGNSYYLLSEGGNDRNRHPIHESKKVV